MLASRRKLLDSAEARLRPVAKTSARQDALLLLGRVLDRTPESLIAHDDQLVTALAARRFFALVTRRAHGEPLAYCLGVQPFFGLDFQVQPGVLIPRPDSELLINTALRLFPRRRRITLADIGTGSGCLGLTLAKYRPDWRVYCADRSPTALKIARMNARRFKVLPRCRFSRGDLLEPVRDIRLDLIVANLPYLTPSEIQAESTIKAEPRLALNGGPDGLRLYRRFFKQLKLRTDRPVVLLEIDPRRKQVLGRLVKQIVPDMQPAWCRDLGGRWRALMLTTNQGKRQK